jgi:aryl-alcohol dehydrogenase-like predicted oxidoreductase
MEYRQLGTGGPKIPVIGLGAWPIGGGMGIVDERNAIDTIHASIDQGITLIDTAQYYRTSEAIIGRALENGWRDRCFIATKVSGKYSRADIRTAIENSLRALKVDVIDLYQIHSWNPQYPVEASLDEMDKLRQEGKVRFLGVSNYNAEQMRRALQTARFESSQPRYNLFDREIEAEDIPFCEREGIGILAHSPLAKGLLGGKYTPDTTFPPEDERSTFPRFQGQTFARFLGVADRLKQVAADKGLTLVQLAIAWQLRLPAITCVLVGAKSAQQVAEYTGAVGVSFTAEELARIETILQDTPGQ